MIKQGVIRSGYLRRKDFYQEVAERGNVKGDWNEIRAQLKDLEEKHIKERKNFGKEELHAFDVPSKADEDLPDSEIKYQEILEYSPNIIFRFNINTNKFEYVSPSSEKGWHRGTKG